MASYTSRPSHSLYLAVQRDVFVLRGAQERPKRFALGAQRAHRLPELGRFLVTLRGKPLLFVALHLGYAELRGALVERALELLDAQDHLPREVVRGHHGARRRRLARRPGNRLVGLPQALQAALEDPAQRYPEPGPEHPKEAVDGALG
jgi:hypothetical protein